MSKQDRQGARTLAELMSRYNFGKTFGEIMGLVESAQRSAEEASKATSSLDEKLTSEEIFNRLTNNGELQGLYRQDGKLHINAEFVKILNLIAETVLSKDSFGGSLEILGGVLRLYQDENILVEITTEYDGYPLLRMTLVTDGEVTTRLEMGPEGSQIIDLTGAIPSVKFAFALDEDGDPAITCKDVSGNIVTKKVVWKSNGDGTFTLCGK